VWADVCPGYVPQDILEVSFPVLLRGYDPRRSSRTRMSSPKRGEKDAVGLAGAQARDQWRFASVSATVLSDAFGGTKDETPPLRTSALGAPSLRGSKKRERPDTALCQRDERGGRACVHTGATRSMIVAASIVPPPPLDSSVRARSRPRETRAIAACACVVTGPSEPGAPVGGSSLRPAAVDPCLPAGVVPACADVREQGR
jgi:hypothetical protein